MADQAVLEVQNWLNATYGNVSGFEKVNPDGHTGWPTIYALREALQHELGITDIGEGFGPATRSALASVVGNLKPGYTGNIAQLIQGAFWCKGIDPGSNLNQEFSTATQQAFKTLQTDAGLNADGIVTVNLMAALFDMSAFVLVAGGDKNVRQLQQWLNADYSQYIGIMPCDGIYQRDTNVGLIYALQRALGISADVANGNFGDATNAALKAVSLSVGATGLLVKIVKYGLYLNSMYDGNFGENFGSDVATSIIKFRKFMKYPNEDSGVADYTVIKGLVTSNGDTSRDSIALDTATQLTATDVQHFRDYGFSIVGRYLTGTVGADFKPKNLTSIEVKTILDGGLKFFPIYEDGGYVESYFTASQGQKDGQTAISAALSLGLPADTVIYFAVDVDFQEGDIDGTVIPYINAVQNVLNRSIYKAGIYGTRNVCLHAEKTGIDYSFVANMSYGWSGNLGFKMPDNWAFDQFVEYPIYGIDIDQDASSGRDQGVSAVTEATPATQKAYVANRLLSIFPDYHNLFGTINWTVSSPTQHITTPLADYYVTLEDKWSATVVDNKTGVLTIQDAKIINESTDILEQFESAMSSYNVGDLAGTFNKLAPMIGNGAIKAGLAIRDGMVGFKVAIESSVENTSTSSSVENQFTLTLETYVHQNFIPQNDYDPVYQPVSEPNPTFVVTLEKVGEVAILGILIIGAAAATLGSAGSAGPVVTALFSLLAIRLFGQN